jgi:hypothetical protein
MAKPAAGGITKYYWYPGEKSDWVRAAAALGSGLLAFGVLRFAIGSTLSAVVLGTSVTAAVAGLTYGRRDVKALQAFCRFAPADTGRAVWRAGVKGAGAAGAAVLVANLGPRGFWADWVLPVVPAVVGALAHQGGMMWERAAQLDTTVKQPTRASESALARQHAASMAAATAARAARGEDARKAAPTASPGASVGHPAGAPGRGVVDPAGAPGRAPAPGPAEPSWPPRGHGPTLRPREA